MPDLFWHANLTAPITLKDGRTLATLHHAADILLSLSDAALNHPWNNYAAGLLMKAAESGEPDDIDEATIQTRRALSREGVI